MDSCELWSRISIKTQKLFFKKKQIEILGQKIGKQNEEFTRGSSKIDLRQQKNESANLKINQQKLCNLKNTQKRMKKHEESLRAIWDTIQSTNIYIMEVLEGETRGNGTKNMPKEIIAVNFPDLMKNTNLYVQETQQTLKRKT